MKVGDMKMGRYRHGVVPGQVEICYISLFVVGEYVRSSLDRKEDNVMCSCAVSCFLAYEIP